MSEPWYIESFGEDYLRIYAHRTDEAAEKEVEQIISLLNMKEGTSVLDLCCGNGRHSRALAKKGYKVTGLDLSEVLLQEAKRKNISNEIRYLHSDVRHIPFHKEFDYIVNLFTSFGYFEELEENMKVFQSIYQALHKGGHFLIDFLNPVYVSKHLVPYSKRQVNELEIIEKRNIIGQKVIKQIEVREGNEVRNYEEQVNLFSLDEMKSMLTGSGLTVTDVYGNFDQEEYDHIKSPRMIIIGKK